jgi:hypothetical protein
MYLPIHNTTLEGIIARPAIYPKAIDEATSIIIEEDECRWPVYLGKQYKIGFDGRIARAQNDCDAHLIRLEYTRGLHDLKLDTRNLVHGMMELSGFAQVMIFTGDLDSEKPAITKPADLPYSYEIRPKLFNLGLTGRVLDDGFGLRHDELLSVRLDIYDVYGFASLLGPKKLLARTKHGLEVIFEKNAIVGEVARSVITDKICHYVLNTDEVKRAKGITTLLPSGNKWIVFDDDYQQTRSLSRPCILFHNPFSDIESFLRYATLANDHLIWKVCESRKGLASSPLAEANRGGSLVLRPHAVNLRYSATVLSFDVAACMRALAGLYTGRLRLVEAGNFSEGTECKEYTFSSAKNLIEVPANTLH